MRNLQPVISRRLAVHKNSKAPHRLAAWQKPPRPIAAVQPPRRLVTGQAMLIIVMFFLSITLITVSGMVTLALSQERTARDFLLSKKSFFAAESGLEDAALRLSNDSSSDDPVFSGSDNSYTLTVDEAVVTIKKTDSPIGQQFVSKSVLHNIVRKTRFINTASILQFPYAVQAGYLGLELKNNGRIAGTVGSNGSIIGGVGSGQVIEEDVTVAGGIGGCPDTEARNAPGVTCGPPPSGEPASTKDLPVRDQSDRRKGAQSFVSSVTALPSKARFYVRKTGSPPNATIKIFDDAGGRPSGSDVIAVGTLNNDDVLESDYGWQSVTFNNPGRLFAGETYWLMISMGGASASNYYKFAGTDDAVYGKGTFLYNSTEGGTGWSPPPPDIGPADVVFELYMGEETTRVEKVQVGKGLPCSGKKLQVHEIKNTDVWLDAYYKTVDEPEDLNCARNPDSPDPPTIPPPITQAMIDEWLAVALPPAEGGSGRKCNNAECKSPEFNDFFPPPAGETGSLPAQNDDGTYDDGVTIPGDFVFNTNATTNITGVVYVKGNMVLEKNCVLKLDESFGKKSGVIIVDGTVRIKDSCAVSGSGDAASHLIILSRSTTTPAVVVQNQASADILYAVSDEVELKDHGSEDAPSAAQAAYAPKVTVREGAKVEGVPPDLTVKSETAFTVTNWRETE